MGDHLGRVGGHHALVGPHLAGATMGGGKGGSASRLTDPERNYIDDSLARIHHISNQNIPRFLFFRNVTIFVGRL